MNAKARDNLKSKTPIATGHLIMSGVVENEDSIESSIPSKPSASLTPLTKEERLSKPSVLMNKLLPDTKLISGFLLKKLAKIEGGYIRIDGNLEAKFGNVLSDLHCKVTINDSKTFSLGMQQGVLGIAEAYLQGYWEVDNLTTLVRIFARNRYVLDRINNSALSKASQLAFRALYWSSRNSKAGSKKNISAHYDLSNAFFKLWLDERMMYSSAIYPTLETSLQNASDLKLKTICDKLDLKSSDTLIEIGTGWGGFAIYAAENYGCHVTTTTISKEQYNEAKARVEKKGLDDKITLLLEDYRDLKGTYDKLVSIEMIEAVGHQYLDGYFAKCASLLKPNGKALIQAITIEDTRYETALKTVDFIKQYVFPGSFIPCNEVMIRSAAKTGLKLTGLQDIGKSYARTLADWRENFFSKIDEVKALGFDERFIRLWDFYLCYCEGGFEEGVISNVHLEFENSMHAL